MTAQLYKKVDVFRQTEKKSVFKVIFTIEKISLKKNIAESLIQSVSHFNLTCLFAITQIDSNSIGFSELVVNRLCLNWTAFIAPLSELVDNFNMTPIKTS